MHHVGIDVGGTKLLGVRIDPDRPGQPLAEHRLGTPPGTTALVDALAALVERVDPGGEGAIGVGVPGLVDRGHRFRYGPNLPGVVDLDLATILGDRLGRPVVAGNDATCAAAAEFRIGAGRGHADGVLVTLGTGIGCGVVVDGAVVLGAHGFAGEPGHMVVDPSGPPCPCGRHGCWERYASGSGLRWLAQEAAASGRLAVLVDAAGGVEAVRGEHVVAAARDGDPEAMAVIETFADWLALGIANLIAVLDPSIVVLGGGLMRAADLFLDRAETVANDQVMGAGHRPRVPVVAASTDESAGAIGAALLAADA